MKFRGRAWVFGDDVNTDYIISAARKEAVRDPREAARHLMEDIRPGFAALVAPGDILVAGSNFGCGSSREAAPVVIQAAGIACVAARSFARIFYRNAVNVGLPLVEVDTRGLADGEEVEVDVPRATLTRLRDGSVRRGLTLPPFMLAMLAEGGLVAYYRRHGRLPWEDADAADARGAARPAGGERLA